MKVRESESQLTLRFDADEMDGFESCREYLADRVRRQRGADGRRVLQKAIAADMDLSPSHLSRKLTQSPEDSMRFTLDDLERFVRVTGDTSPIVWLVHEYLSGKDDRIAELEAELARLRRARA